MTTPNSHSHDTTGSAMPAGDAVSRWPHRWSVLLTLIVFPLIWVGGLVTTYDAGMAVPDWPTSYGYNMVLYPWETWLYGPWDLFIEHGHRLLGTLAGLVTIALVISVFRGDPRRWMRPVSLAALALVVAQGLLGGIRVLAVDREIAKLHGCVGPAFFALAAVLAVLTSSRWREAGIRGAAAPASIPPATAASLKRLAFLTLFFAYFQLVIGAHLRHIAVEAAPSVYRALVLAHLAIAAVVAAHAWWLADRTRRGTPDRWLRRPAGLLAVAVGLQLLLGLGTWIVKFGWPSMLGEHAWAATATPVAKSMLQANIVTAHVALGSLIVAFSAVLACRVARLLRAERAVARVGIEPAPLKYSGAVS